MARGLDSLPGGVGESREAAVDELPPDSATMELEWRLFNESFSEHFGCRRYTRRETSDVYRTARARGEWLFTLLARLEGEPVGFLLGGALPEAIKRRGANVGRLHILGVLKPFRNRGIAKALLIAGMERLKGRGMTEAELRVDTGNATGALQLYELLGFKTAGRRLTQTRDLT
jgi:mycothiol synthase